jgi:hypothetical protein
VIADFNGDGERDIVMDGQSPRRTARIALLWYWEQAGVLYYWDGRAFAQYVTGD